MAADIDELADAVAAMLNDDGTDWHDEFTAEVRSAPVFETEALSELQVVVMPFGEEWKSLTRGTDTVTMRVDVGFQKRAGAMPASGEDPVELLAVSLRRLVKNVNRYLRLLLNRKPATYQAAWLEKSVVELYDSQSIRDDRTFRGNIQLFYREDAISNRE